MLSECTRITWPNTLPAEFLQRPSFHRVEYLFGRLIALVPSPYPVAGRVDRRSRDYDTIDLEGVDFFAKGRIAWRKIVED